MDPLKTGKVICEARKKLNMTQKDLANKLFVSDKAVSKWERGLCFPDISVLIPLAEILKISLYDLLKGEKMNEKKVEETLKDTINYSNNEVNKKKKKFMLISVIIILLVSILCVLIIIFNSNSALSGVIDRDTIYQIDYYENYKTTLNNKDGKNIEAILERLSLSWIERTFELSSSKIIVNYKENYDKVIKAYNDEDYVELALINNVTVLFTTISDLESVEVKFNDYSFSAQKNDVLKAFSIKSFQEISELSSWNNIVSNNLVNDDFVKNTFKLLFKKEKVKK